MSGGTYSLKLSPNDRFFERLFMAVLFTLIVFEKNLLRGSRRNIFHISIFDDSSGMRTQAFESTKPTLYILDHCDIREGYLSD